MAPFSTVTASQDLLQKTLADKSIPIPDDIRGLGNRVKFEGKGEIVVPVPFHETESIAALKAVESLLAIAIAQKRFGAEAESVTSTIDCDHATLGLFLCYISSVNGYKKWDKESEQYLQDSDIHRAQSNLYRSLVSNIYKTKDGYYHLHGSLDSTPTLELLGLPGFQDQLDNYDEIVNTI
jgi:hypothetical protein